MKLARVEYEFFEFEDPSPTATELARQVRLVFSDGPRLFLSWIWERQRGPACEPYTVGYGETSFFRDEPAKVVDASKSPAWSKHLGQDVELFHAPATSPAFDYQVLEVRSVAGHTFVYSLGVDQVGISGDLPIPRGVGKVESPSEHTA